MSYVSHDPPCRCLWCEQDKARYEAIVAAEKARRAPPPGSWAAIEADAIAGERADSRRRWVRLGLRVVLTAIVLAVVAAATVYRFGWQPVTGCVVGSIALIALPFVVRRMAQNWA